MKILQALVLISSGAPCLSVLGCLMSMSMDRVGVTECPTEPGHPSRLAKPWPKPFEQKQLFVT